MDSFGKIIRVNKAIEHISGYSPSELIGKSLQIFKTHKHASQFYTDMWIKMNTDGYWEGELWSKKKNGDAYPQWMSLTALKQKEGKLEYYLAVSTDISKIKNAEAALYQIANYDGLTGIPNRTLFYEHLERALTRIRKTQKSLAVLFIDLDGFNLINDSLGHAAGDQFLKEIVQRMRACLSSFDIFSRIGGDDFTIILEGVSGLDQIRSVAESLIASIASPYHLTSSEIILSASIGIAVAPVDDDSVDGLIRKAEAAMYDAKTTGKRGSYSFTSLEIEKRNQEKLEMQVKLRKALQNDEFELYLQPQVAWTANGICVTGAEALIRWRTKDGQLFTPDKFIPLAESNGMIIPIGYWLVEEIARIDQQLKSHGITIKLAINISASQLESDEFADLCRRMMEKQGVQPIHLEIEITERSLLRDFEQAILNLKKLKQIGLEIALDDFGTGFSSLSYLTKLPIDYLKIDKSFVDDIATEGSKNLTPTIISMAKTLGIKTIAEGVETRQQLHRLIHERCDEIQGYLFSKPLDVTHFIDFVQMKQHLAHIDVNDTYFDVG